MSSDFDLTVAVFQPEDSGTTLWDDDDSWSTAYSPTTSYLPPTPAPGGAPVPTSAPPVAAGARPTGPRALAGPRD